MPQIQPTEITNEESKQQLENQESLQNDVLDKIKSGDVFKSLDLPITEEHQDDRITKEDRELQREQQQEEEQVSEDVEQDNSEEEIEEVVPKSKIQPRIDQLTAKLKAQQAEIDALKNQSSMPKDEIQSQLDAMSEDALEDSLTQVRVAKEKSRDDDSKLLELVKLERRIEKTISTAPQKFAQNQINEANQTIKRLADDGDLNNENYSKVIEIAKTIYEKYPKMQKALDGQAMAIDLAVEHYKQVSKSSSIKADTQNLKVQINNLKKKTALDTKNIKGGGDKINLDKLRSNALSGTMKDKERYARNDPRFKIDAMIPDFLKG